MIVDGVGSYSADVIERLSSERQDRAPRARVGELLPVRRPELECLKKVWLEPRRGILSDEFYNMPGLGAVYSRASTYIFGDWNKCGELMGLAPYGRPDAVQPLLDMKDGELTVPEWPAEFTRPFLIDTRRSGKTSPAMQHWQDVAWRVQDDAEKVLLARARWLRETTGAKNLCIAGGVALNCVANGRIAREAGFENVWIQPAAGDDGIAIGCAYYGHVALRKKPRSFVMNARLSRAWPTPTRTCDDADAKSACPGRRPGLGQSEDICAETAKLLAEGNVIGWFQGRSEFGPRALGNRSIIADPRTPEMKDKLNSRVKFRQAFRPFAPIVLYERANEIFEGDEDSPYMLLAKRVRPEWRDKIPAIVHVDGTARVQTVRQENQRAALSAAQGVRRDHRRAGAAQHVVQREGRADRRDAAATPWIASCRPASTIWHCTTG